MLCTHKYGGGGRWEENNKQVKNIVFWKHWEGSLVWKGKLAYTFTLLIIQWLCNNYSSTQKINETKVNNLRNKTHTCFLIPMMKGYGLKVKHQVNSRVSLIKKGRQGSIGNIKVKKTCLYASLNIYNVWVYIITSTQAVKKWERKYAYSSLQLS